jgi:threonine aldolase
MLGGGMRQAGIVAAPAIIALEEMTKRLGEDHLHARRFAEGIAAFPGIAVDAARVQTNIVFFRITDARFTLETFIRALAEQGLRVGELGHGRLRAVTHAGISRADVDAALAIVREVLDRGPSAS